MNEINFIGYDTAHGSDFIYDIPEGFSCYLLVLTTTPSRIRIDHTVREYPPHTAVLYPPGYTIWYGANKGAYGDHWIRFATDESFVIDFPLQATPFPISDPAYCRNLLQLLTWESSYLLNPAGYQQNPIFSGSPKEAFSPNPIDQPEDSHRSQIIDQLLRILFTKLKDDILAHGGNCQSPTKDRYDYQLLDLRRRIASNPQLSWSIADMAEQLHISCGYLQLLYKQKFNVSCMEDVITFRLFKARDLLIYTAKSIAEIAEECGYANTEHFCRQFRKRMGCRPGEVRLMNEKAD